MTFAERHQAPRFGLPLSGARRGDPFPEPVEERSGDLRAIPVALHVGGVAEAGIGRWDDPELLGVPGLVVERLALVWRDDHARRRGYEEHWPRRDLGYHGLRLVLQVPFDRLD